MPSVGGPRSCSSTSPAAACDEAVARAVGALGGLDILVNNAFHDGNRKAFLDAARGVAPDDGRELLGAPSR